MGSGKRAPPFRGYKAGFPSEPCGAVPLGSAEGFIRQVLGWREFVRGAYGRFMPGLGEANHYGHARKLPAWYWTGDTRMACMRECIGQTLRYGYAHHIQRLMVTGQFALLAEIEPRQVCDWYLARLDPAERRAIRRRASEILRDLDAL